MYEMIMVDYRGFRLPLVSFISGISWPVKNLHLNTNIEEERVEDDKMKLYRSDMGYYFKFNCYARSKSKCQVLT